MATASAQVPARLSRAAGSPLRQTLLYAALGLVALLALIYQVRFTVDVYKDIVSGGDSARMPFNADPSSVTVKSMSPEATSAGLKAGDEVVQVNGLKVNGMNVLHRAFDRKHPGDMMKVVVMRQHHPVTIAIRLAQEQGGIGRGADLTLNIVLALLMPWFSLLLGFYVALARPRDPLAWMVLGLLLSFSQIVNNSLAGWSGWIRLPAEIYHTTLFMFWPLFMFLFGYYFPEPFAFEKKHPWIKWIAIGPSLLMGLIVIPVSVGLLEDLPHFGPLSRMTKGAGWFIFTFACLMISAGIAMLGVKSGRTRNRDARRRLKLLVWGVAASLTPLAVLAAVEFVRKQAAWHTVPVWAVVVALFALLLFPFTLAYVIVVRRALDVRMVVRQGLQYTFARSGVRALWILTCALFAWVAYLIAKRIGNHVPLLVLLSLVAAGAVVLLNFGAKRLAKWIDRRFFRDAYNAEIVLAELSEQVRAIREASPLLETVVERIAVTLHVSRLAVFTEEGGRFRPSYTLGFEREPEVEFAAGSPVAGYLAQTREAPRVYFDDETSWLYRTPGLGDEDRSKLAYLGAELLLPLASHSNLLGFIAAGQKKSEEPYSKSDVRILSSVAAQTGLALENARLTSAVAAEIASREGLAREVEIAREVQERLFPQSRPGIDGLDYSGMCRTALGVGGDYYDFLALPNGRLGFAVGDVSGKGISAALLMASLQASLRGETSNSSDDLATLLGTLNRRVYEASASNRYATFFYAQYSPAARQLAYVNAGHNPPILMRRTPSGWDVSLLEAGGTVVGLLPAASYEQSALTLRPGDYLVAYTDGVSEAMNSVEEEWGEERLTETIRACAESSLPACETMQRILSSADTFVAGAKQHDDMTLVVLRIL